MIIQRLFSEKSEKDKKKAKVAGKVAAVGGAGSIAAGLGSKYLKNKADYLTLVHKDIVPAVLEERFDKTPGLEERYTRRADRAIKKSENTAKKLGKAGIALGAASVGAGLYALKKKKDSKKNK